MQSIQGDLIALAKAGKFDVIVHGCNCQCTMGAGIAKLIKAEFPEAFAADQATEKGSRAKLGSISTASIHRDGMQLTVVNAYTQWHYRGSGTKVDYTAIEQAMQLVAEQFANQRIGMPRIGAGLGGGDWSRIEAILADKFGQLDCTVVFL